MAKYNYNSLAKQSVWTEAELKAFMRHINNSDNRQEALDAFFSNRFVSDGSGIKLSPEQIAKGLKWLKNLAWTPTGRERITNPLGYREMAIVKDPKATIRIKDWYQPSFWTSWRVPLYVVYGDKTSMEYYVTGGKINIVG